MLSFNGIDLNDYNLIVVNRNLPVNQRADYTQLKDRAYAGGSKLSPKMITLDVKITGDDTSDLESNIDSIRATLNSQVDGDLILDALPDRYWTARFESLEGQFNGPRLWEGQLVFMCYDPLAFAVSGEDDNYSVDDDPKTIVVAVAGTGFALPVFTLTAGEGLTDVEITVENLTTDEALTWSGSMGNGEVLEIDTDAWTVKLEGTDDMAISGQFPRLQPGNNSIRITGFSNTGSLNIKYRARYI